MSTDRLEHCNLKLTPKENAYLEKKAEEFGNPSRQSYLLDFLCLHDPNFPREERSHGKWNKGKTGKRGHILSDKQEEFKQLCWGIATDQLDSDDCLLIANLKYYSFGLCLQNRYNFLSTFIPYGKEKEDVFAGVKWILEDLLTISHKTNPFIIFKNLRIDRLVEGEE